MVALAPFKICLNPSNEGIGCIHIPALPEGLGCACTSGAQGRVCSPASSPPPLATRPPTHLAMEDLTGANSLAEGLAGTVWTPVELHG